MKIGFGLPHHGALVGVDYLEEVAVGAEERGYDSLWTLDRIVKTLDFTTPYPGSADGSLGPEYDTVFEHLSVLGHVAALTSRIRLGVSVLNLPLYHPVMLARRLATLDHLSRGRLDVGFGVGWSEDEFRAAGGDFHQRGRRSTEYVQALKALWGPDPVEFHGETVEVPASIYGPKPLQQPHPPLYLGAYAGPALRRAGRLADGFSGCCVPVDAVLDFRAQAMAAALAAGRDATLFLTVVRCNVHLTDSALDDATRPVGTGTWAQLRDDTLRLADAGVDEVFFDVFHEPGIDRDTAQRHLDRFVGILE